MNILTKDSKKYTVYGFFPLTDPWWSVSVTVYGKPRNYQYYVKGFPSYNLEDDILGEESILAIFLTKCNVHNDYIAKFMAWVKDGPPVTFSNLMNLAKQFDETDEAKIIPYLVKLGM